jgi:hypothetical protein
MEETTLPRTPQMPVMLFFPLSFDCKLELLYIFFLLQVFGIIIECASSMRN